MVNLNMGDSMKLIDEKKFRKELKPYLTNLTNKLVDDLLSKHTKDLTKKKEGALRLDTFKEGSKDGYNQCLEDCEGK